MTKPAPLPALVQAAQDLENELRECEDALTESAKTRLNTEKNIGRAARSLQKANEHREATAARANALMAAIQAAHARSQETTARMEERAREIQSRLEQLNALRARAETIVVAVREVTEAARGAKTPAEILERLSPVEKRIDDELKEARAQDFDDVAHEIAGLREMIATVRRKLGGA